MSTRLSHPHKIYGESGIELCTVGLNGIDKCTLRVRLVRSSLRLLPCPFCSVRKLGTSSSMASKSELLEPIEFDRPRTLSNPHSSSFIEPKNLQESCAQNDISFFPAGSSCAPHPPSSSAPPPPRARTPTWGRRRRRSCTRTARKGAGSRGGPEMALENSF